MYIYIYIHIYIYVYVCIYIYIYSICIHILYILRTGFKKDTPSPLHLGGTVRSRVRPSVSSPRDLPFRVTIMKVICRCWHALFRLPLPPSLPLVCPLSVPVFPSISVFLLIVRSLCLF